MHRHVHLHYFSIIQSFKHKFPQQLLDRPDVRAEVKVSVDIANLLLLVPTTLSLRLC